MVDLPLSNKTFILILGFLTFSIFIILFKLSHISSIRVLAVVDTPVVRMSTSMVPVLGLIADCFKAFFQIRLASSTSSVETSSESRTLALASAKRMRPSS